MFLRTVELAFARFQAKGEAKALAIVFDRTAPELLRVARHLASQPSDAEDTDRMYLSSTPRSAAGLGSTQALARRLRSAVSTTGSRASTRVLTTTW